LSTPSTTTRDSRKLSLVPRPTPGTFRLNYSPAIRSASNKAPPSRDAVPCKTCFNARH
jgi:hypothetical protein